MIVFERKDAGNLRLEGEKGCVITNPPYGERSSDEETAEKALTILGKLIRENPTWSFFILSPRQNLRPMIPRKPPRQRKLYNGKIRCYLHQFFGPMF